MTETGDTKALRRSVLPLREGDKRPLIRSEHLQNERPTENDVAEWFRRWPHANVGIRHGREPPRRSFLRWRCRGSGPLNSGRIPNPFIKHAVRPSLNQTAAYEGADLCWLSSDPLVRTKPRKIIDADATGAWPE
jgi:Bifunctional DNA primase/polymerase, N-terminal